MAASGAHSRISFVPSESRPISRAYAFYALGLLMLINMSNYADRQALHSMAAPISEAFQLSARQFGLLATAFFITSALASLPLSYWADRWSRRNVIALGTLVWSVATLACAHVRGFHELFLARAVLGLGEAACVPAALALIGDYFPRSQRARVVAAFASAMVFGGGLGILLGAHFAESSDPDGWRRAFWVLGPPGFLLAAAAFRLAEPPRGAAEEAEPYADASVARGFRSWNGGTHGKHAVTISAVARILRIPTFRLVLMGTVCLYFAAGALMVWVPTLFQRYKGISLVETGFYLGIVLLFFALLGMAVGGSLADRLSSRWAGGTVLVVGAGLVLASPFVAGFIVAHGRIPMIGSLCIAAFFISWSALAAAVVYGVVEPPLRASALAFPTLAGHLLGDAAAPPIIGHLSDVLGDLGKAMTLIPAFVLASGIAILLAMRTIAADTEAMARRMSASGSAPAENSLKRLGER